MVQPDGWARGEREGYGGPRDVTSHSHSVQPDGWARGEREGYGGPSDVTSLSLSLREDIATI